MKTFNKKKGFTIVELVIVIAVIGVLTAVLVPTFVNLVNKANNASDESLVKNLNTQLRMKEQTEGKNATFTDALLDAKEAGYLVENLTPRGDRDILWSQEKDEFVFNNEVVGETYKYWKIYEKAADVPATQVYSIFAKGTEWTTVPTLTVGFDAGENEGIAELNFATEAAVSAIIRTNGAGTVLTINAANATVHHYDFLDNLTVTAIAGESYHEHGTIKGKVSIAEGHFVMEKTGSAQTIVVTADSASDVSLDLTQATEENAPVIYAENEEVAAQLDTIVEGSEEVKESSIQTVTYTKRVTNAAELEAALNENGYVIVDNDIEVSEPVWITETDHIVTLDLNGKTISASSTGFQGRPLMNQAILTIEGEGTISSVNAGEDGWGAVRNYNELIINGGTFLGNPLGGGSAIDNWQGNLVINDGFFGGTGSLNNRDNGIAVINGGRFVSEACSKLPGECYAYALRSSGIITVNNAYVRGAHGGVAIYGGEALINNIDSEAYACGSAEGQIEDHSSHGDVSYYALYVAGESTTTNCTVKGGKFKTNKLYCVLIGNSTPGDGGNRQKAHATIYGGEFVSKTGVSIIKINGELGSAYLFGGKYSNNDVIVGSAHYTLSDISSLEAQVVQEGDWFVVK